MVSAARFQCCTVPSGAIASIASGFSSHNSSTSGASIGLTLPLGKRYCCAILRQKPGQTAQLRSEPGLQEISGDALVVGTRPFRIGAGAAQDEHHGAAQVLVRAQLAKKF